METVCHLALEGESGDKISLSLSLERCWTCSGGREWRVLIVRPVA